jgi:hypothetical protein
MPTGIYLRVKKRGGWKIKDTSNMGKHLIGKKRPPFSQEWKDKISKSNKGKITWNKGTKGLMSTPWKKGLRTGKNTKLSQTKLGKPILANQGKNHWNWRGGTSKYSNSRRCDKLYQAWVRAIKIRDNYTCRLKDNNCKGQLVAHHILRWQDYPKIRYNINNGITLCRHHHPRKMEDEIKLIPLFQSLVEVIGRPFAS